MPNAAVAAVEVFSTCPPSTAFDAAYAIAVAVMVVLTIAEGLARFALLQIFRFPAPFGDLMMYVVLPQALCNGFVGAAVVLALAWSQTVRGRLEGSRP